MTGWVCQTLRGGGWRAAPPPPARQAGRTRRTGLPRDRDRARTPGGNAPATKGGLGMEPQAAPQKESRGATAQPPPPCPPTPPHRPASRGGAGPHPPEAEGMIPPPPGRTAAPEREAGARPAPPSQPPAPAGTTENKRTRANAPGRHTDRARRRQASTNRSSMGATPTMTRATPVTPALLPAQGRQMGQTEAGRPTAPLAPPAAQSEGTAHRPPSPPHPTP